jgi:methionyl aminopeptidase
MKEGGRRLQKVIKELLPIIQVGISTKEIDEAAGRLIKKYGGTASFKKVKGYHWNTCLPINEQVVHTPPSERIIKEGDVLTIDIGLFYRGFHTDWATTILVGKKTDGEIKRFLNRGELALKQAIGKIKPGNFLGEVSQTIEEIIGGSGYFVIKELTGHGIGRDLHEEPYVLGYLDRPIKKTLKIRPGLVLAVEVIFSMGTTEVTSEKEGDWSLITKDRSLSACFEETVAVADRKTLILTG